MERIRLGRESLDRRRAAHASSGGTTPLESPRLVSADHDDDDDVDVDMERARTATPEADHRRRSWRKSSAQIVAEKRSRFIEGSMRDRASIPPPREYVGSTEASESEDEEDEYLVFAHDREKTPPPTSEKKKKFTFGLGSLFKFNPFALVDEAKAAYVRQKAIHEAREAKKKEMIRQKEEAEQLYFQMKARGDFKGAFKFNADNDGDEFGLEYALSDNVHGSARKRKHGEVASVGSEMDKMPEYFTHPNEYDSEGSARVEGEEDEEGEDTDEDPLEEQDAVLHALRYEDTISGPPPSADKPRSKKSAMSIFSTNSARNSCTSLTPAKPLTKRELEKAMRLAKKVSNLEDQLEKARRELVETSHGESLLSGSPSPEQMPPPPRPASPQSFSHPNQMLPDTPAPTHDDQVANGKDEDLAMDEEFSIIPLSPELNSSNIMDTPSIMDTPQLDEDTTKTAGRPVPRKAVTVNKTNNVTLNGSCNGSSSAGKPERKKRKGDEPEQ